MKKQRGFSIGEVLVALFLLLVGMVDAVVLTARSIKDVTDSREMIIATQLAQEGTELVRNVRDNTVTEVDGTGKHLTAFANNYGFPISDAICTIDFDQLESAKKIKCSNLSSVLHFDQVRGLYTHTQDADTVPTKYKRQVYISYDNTHTPSNGIDDKVAIVTSVVVYGKGDLPKQSDISSIDSVCKRGKKCVYAQTRLTSWINVEE